MATTAETKPAEVPAEETPVEEPEVAAEETAEEGACRAPAYARSACVVCWPCCTAALTCSFHRDHQLWQQQGQPRREEEPQGHPEAGHEARAWHHPHHHQEEQERALGHRQASISAPRTLPHTAALAPPPQILFVFSSPDVYKSSNSDTYVVFGEAKIEDLSQQAAAAAAQQFQMPTSAAAQQAAAGAASADAGKSDDAADEEDVDAGDLEAKDIELVMQQADVSRAAAIKALKSNDGDMVNAIMELTMA